MKLRRKAALVSLLSLPAAGLLSLTAGPAQAAASTFSDRESFPAAGSVFSCQGGDLTAQTGTVDSVVHGTQDDQGIFHITGTTTTHGVTLTDADGNVYTLAGASWFGGKSTDAEGNNAIVFTDTEHFVIRNASGGVYAKVQIVAHVSQDGSFFSFDKGACEEPND
jgi:hypothetical protein